MARIQLLLTYFVLLTFAPADVTCAADNLQQDVAAVQKLLKEKFPRDTWAVGPTRLTSRAIDTAYPGSRFYYVFSPQYPVARAGQISAVIRINKQGEVRRIEQPQDYSQGLAAIRIAYDAKVAGAAVMSLILGPMGPAEIAPNEVDAKATANGWTATSTRQQGRWLVEFDAKGRCVQANYQHLGPLPICIGGLFRVVAAPQGVIAGNQPARIGLLVDSVEPGSIAARGGLLKGDVLVGFDGRALPDEDTIQKMRQTVYGLKQQPGVSRSVMLIRDGQTLTVDLTW